MQRGGLKVVAIEARREDSPVQHGRDDDQRDEDGHHDWREVRDGAHARLHSCARLSGRLTVQRAGVPALLGNDALPACLEGGCNAGLSTWIACWRDREPVALEEQVNPLLFTDFGARGFSAVASWL